MVLRRRCRRWSFIEKLPNGLGLGQIFFSLVYDVDQRSDAFCGGRNGKSRRCEKQFFEFSSNKGLRIPSFRKSSPNRSPPDKIFSCPSCRFGVCPNPGWGKFRFPVSWFVFKIGFKQQLVNRWSVLQRMDVYVFVPFPTEWDKFVVRSFYIVDLIWAQS